MHETTEASPAQRGMRCTVEPKGERPLASRMRWGAGGARLGYHPVRCLLT
jgi:hypothetical protein